MSDRRTDAERESNGDDRHPASGRFLPGNQAAVGRRSGIAERSAALREALFRAVKPKDLEAVVAKLVELAQGGDVAAARELLNRMVGKAVETVVADLEHRQAPELSPEDEAIAARIIGRRLSPAYVSQRALTHEPLEENTP